MNLLFVAGDFGANPKASGYARKLFKHLINQFNNIDIINYRNGGCECELDSYFITKSPNYDVIVWMPNISNESPKRLKHLKELYPHAILVMSKWDAECKYSYLHLAAKMLQVKANLMLHLDNLNGKFIGRILDPLGNQFISEGRNSADVENIAEILGKRIVQLLRVTRLGSIEHPAELNTPAPQEDEFFKIARQHAETFHNIIHADTTRFLGNLSFRCEHGFPSYRDADYVFVSQRNIDKRFIVQDGFVAVKLDPGGRVHYYGSQKPSVDTPVQLELYRYYKHVKYMLHSHVYIDKAPFTKSILPCGAIEEANEIIHLYQDRESSNFCVNLMGHGSLILASNVDYLRDIPYIKRKMPELYFI